MAAVLKTAERKSSVSSNLTASAKFNVTEETNMLIPLPKVLSSGLTKYGKAELGRQFTVDVLMFIMAKSEHLPEKMSRNKAINFAYRMGRGDMRWQKYLSFHRDGKKELCYSGLVMDAGEEYLKQEKLDKQ